MEYEIKCTTCHKTTQNHLDYKCPKCGNPLEVNLTGKFETKQTQKRNQGHWRYATFYPYVKEDGIVTLGEGWTPIVEFNRNLCFKLESLNPTGSFKDRGSTTLISAIHKNVKKKKGHITEDSSGNAGASIAAYAARANLKARIYVPQSVSGPKFNQIQFYAAQVEKVSGSRAKVAEEAQRTRKNGFYIGHILHPLFRDGMRSLAYELHEQLNRQIPECIFLPVSAGTLLLGLLSGFTHLLESGTIDTLPKIVACQTSQVSPLYHAIKNLRYSPPEKVTSIADALVSTDPPLLKLMAKKLTEAKGDAVTVEEDEIREAFKELARKGFLVEPSSAVAYAGYKKQLEKEEIPDSAVLIILTGYGLKTTLKPE